MGLSFWHILLLALVALVLFGKGRVSDLMGDVAKGIKSFRKGLAEEEEPRLENDVTKLNKAVDVTPQKESDK